MRISGPVAFYLILFLTACSGAGSVQEKELVESGFTAMSDGDYQTAEYLLNQALTLNDKNPYTLLNLGVIYQETRRYDDARRLFQSVIDLNPRQTAVTSNVEGYAGKNLADIARINMENLPQPKIVDVTTRDQNRGNANVDNDADADGVADDIDQCRGTPAKADVNTYGCWTLVGVFPSGQTQVSPNAVPKLRQVKAILQNNPSIRLEIQGHTDNQGDAAANMRLSEKRAKAVMRYLIEQGVNSERLQWAAFGQTHPIASNDTREGRELNRRVQLHPIP